MHFFPTDPKEDPPALYISGHIKKEPFPSEDRLSDPDVLNYKSHRLSVSNYVKEEPLSGSDQVSSSFEVSTSTSHAKSPWRLVKEDPLSGGEHIPNLDLFKLTHDMQGPSIYSKEEARSGEEHLCCDTSPLTHQQQLTFVSVKEEPFSSEESIVDPQFITATEHLHCPSTDFEDH